MNPAPSSGSADRRFALLRHDSPRGVHFDLLLEAGTVLKTWELPSLPEPGARLAARALPDHRTEYLDHEGPISGDRGSVARWDGGTFTPVDEGPTRWEVLLHGRRVCGRLVLEEVDPADQRWQCACYAGPPDRH